LPIQALNKKGFKVILTTSEAQFIKDLKKADIAWFISGTEPQLTSGK
jgi:hypothetical protein